MVRETRPRKNPIKEYPENEPTFTMIPNSALLGELDGTIDQYGHIYTTKSLAGKRVKILIYR